MNVEIIAVGSELLGAERVDTNSLWLTARLNELGFEVTAKSVVGDHRPRLVQAFRQAWDSATVTIATGGLGPTEDDLTRDAAAEALDLKLIFQPDIWDDLQAKFSRLGRPIPENNRRQAFVLDGAIPLANPRGTAPGQFYKHQNQVLILLPGPPRELQPMMLEHVLPRLKPMAGDKVLARRSLQVIGLGESALDERIAHLGRARPEISITTLFTPLGLEVHLSGPDDKHLMELQEQMAGALEPHVYSRSGQSLAEVVGELLLSRQATLVSAESLTGGLVAERVTAVAGASRYFLGAYITYTDAMKHNMLGVGKDLLAEHTAVSAPVAEAMAQGARQRSGATYALSLTGYAGPDGPDVGTVFIGLATPEGVSHRRLRFPGDRELVRSRAAQAALDWLRLS